MAVVNLETHFDSQNQQENDFVGSISSDSIFGSTYNLQWLFDPDRIDHLPIEEQLKLFKHRDLRKTKVYKIASKIWGGPLSRKRVCVAPPMNGMNIQEHPYVSIQPAMSADLKPKQIQPPALDREIIQLQLEKDKIAKYKQWIVDRKDFRKNMDNLGLSEEYLTKKPDKTALERRVLRRMLQEKYPKVATPPPREETPLEAIIPEELPVVQRPSPMAIRIIERFLHEKKMRLIDLFASVDKDKNWKVSREEFRQAITKAKIPISEVLLEDLILTLDTDLTNELDYRELAKGMGLWKIEKRESKRKLLSSASFSSAPSKFSQMSGFESPDKLEKLERQVSSKATVAKSKSSPIGSASSSTSLNKEGETSAPGVKGEIMNEASRPETKEQVRERSSSTTRVKSALSTISSTSSKNLEPPDLDLRPEIRVFNSDESMVDLRKRDREALARLQGGKKNGENDTHPKKRVTTDLMIANGDTKTMVKTGEKAIDNHMLPSTLGDSTAEQVDRFRHLRFMEYHQICKLCKERNVPLTEDLLQKVLMYPPDRSHKDIKRQVRQPSERLLPRDFAVPKVDKNRYLTPSPDQQENQNVVTKVKVSKEGKIQVLVDSRQAYPSKSKVSALPIKMNLSSGKAVIRRQVDCWLTYEEYERLTRKFSTRYVDLHGKADENAFWPGHLLDKIALCMPNPPPLVSSVFTLTKQNQRTNPGYDNNLRSFPINDAGYVQYGTIDK